jgi:hypothetical protein
VAIGLFDFLPAGDFILSGYLISGSATLAAFGFFSDSSTFFSSLTAAF